MVRSNRGALSQSMKLFSCTMSLVDLKPRTSRFYAKNGWTQKQNHAPQATILSALLVRCISGFGILPIQSQYPNKLARIRALPLHFGPVLRQGTLATCALTNHNAACVHVAVLRAALHWVCLCEVMKLVVKGSEHGPIHCSF